MKILNYEFVIKKRPLQKTGETAIMYRLVSLIAGLILIGVLFFFNGVDPVSMYINMIRVNILLLPETFTRFIPLLLIGLGLALPFKARIDNIGAEGQFIIGAVTAAGTAFLLPDLSPIILIPLMFINGFVAGALWALPIAFFRSKGGFQGADVVVSFLLVFPATYILEYLVSGPWRDPDTGFTYSPVLPVNSHLPSIIPTTRIHLTIILAIAAAIIIYLFFYQTRGGIPKSKLGLEIDITGKNPEAARVTGINFFKIVLTTMIISGGLAGIAGAGEIAGNQLRLGLNISVGYGFTAIAVAYLGGLNPIGIVLSALFFAGLYVGGVAIQIAGLPASSIDLFNGIILFFVLIAEFSIRYHIVRRKN